jgi:hypothetical protein
VVSPEKDDLLQADEKVVYAVDMDTSDNKSLAQSKSYLPVYLQLVKSTGIPTIHSQDSHGRKDML